MTDAMRMLQTMVAMQEAHNAQIATDWRERGLPFYRAVWVECAELLDHYGWKWWKQQTPDLGQVKLEIVDIWHFGLSQLMQEQRVDAEVAAALANALPLAGAQVQAEHLRACVESLALSALGEKSFSIPAFVALMQAMPLPLRELFEMYVGKNVLNRFRQDHGYAEGSYRKLWSGREDNVHLLEVVADLDPGRADYVAAVYAALRERYERSVGQAG